MLCRSDLEDDIALYIKDRVPKAEIRTVFDVGSNVGWFTHEFGKIYRDAQFYLFEPSPPIFAGIEEVLTRFPDLNYASRTHCFQLALGHSEGTAKITVMSNVTVNRIVEQSDAPTVDVEIQTGDGFCREHRITHIDYLKVDAEGYDMYVLIGFTKMLAAGNVDFVQVEAGMALDNKEHIHLDVFSGFLSLFGYRLFRFINQASPAGLPYMSRADVVFIHASAVQRFAT